ncbi:hypothetical protein [Acinetobacter indicus]|uniref:hypothetical protein n=1 Tax=Acinetobacter indicus TaxID=756892 RepID=UPI00257633FD|nr:hypothetical protein [Acinetobacter indicus]MDM1329217.1 hypothetical protein [Acinetobacter indicus]MDM1337757.1 hypothetical protein [Acinetobacter indicus]
MIEFYCSNSEVKDLLEDYWKSDDAYNFIYTQKYLLNKYEFKSTASLEAIVKKNGYGFVNEQKYLCPECKQPHKFFLRKDFKDILKRFSLNCNKCEVKAIEEKIIEAYNFSIGYILDFNKIYNANLNYQYDDDFYDIFERLNYLELVYLYVIIDRNNPNCFGKLGAKNFPLFLHEEFYSDNKVLQSLRKKRLLFYTLGTPTKDYIDFINFSQSFYKNEISVETCNILNEIKGKNLDFFNIILRLQYFNFKSYKALLFKSILEYKFSLNELEDLSVFLKDRRRSEVLFLSDTVEYNTNFKILKDNAIDYKIELLKDTYNLKEIYGYFNSSVNASLYKLDTLNDIQRKYLKNNIYTNIFKSGTEKRVFKKDLPRNYRKSSLLKFIEENYELECVWEDMPVNDFIKKFFNKLQLCGNLSEC